MLRESVREGTRLGLVAREFMNAGRLVPDELIIEMMRERLSREDAAGGFMLDGFPRTVAQAEALDDLMAELKLNLDAVVLLEIPDEAVVKRLTSRRVCASCGSIYNTEGRKPAVEGVCDDCGGDVIQRDDDKERVIKNRLGVYREQTSPLVEYYEKRRLLQRVDAAGARDSALKHLESMKVTG
jgi:adenylate kinase